METALDLKARAFWELGDLEAVEPLLANPGTEPLDARVCRLSSSGITMRP